MKKIILSSILFVFSVMLYSQGWMQYLPKEKSDKEVTFYDYQAAFNHWCQVKKIDNTGYYMEKGSKKKAYGWKQFKRWEIQMEGWYDGKTGAFYDIDIWKEYEKYGILNRSVTDNYNGGWTNLAYAEEGYGNDGNGRINCLAFHPTDPDVFWVGTPWGGIWGTQDHGNTWTPLSDNIGHIGIGAIAIPSDYDVSQTIYLGTGDRASYLDKGVGILKSTDGGMTWNQTGLSYSDPSGLYVTRLLISPGNNDIIYAATSGGVYKTYNGGVFWQLKQSLAGVDMEFHPGNDSIIYVSTRTMNDSTKIWRSIDGGSQWSVVLSVPGVRTELGVSPDEPDWVYAIAANSLGGLRGFYKSTDSGANFSLVYDGAVFGQNLLAGNCYGLGWDGQGSFDLCIAVNPTNAENVFIGGIVVRKSNDSGASWEIVNDSYVTCSGINSNVHVDEHWLEFQYDSDTLFLTTDGGIYFSPNNGTYFTNISGGLIINQPYRISSSQQIYDKIIMGQQDNGTVLWENNSTTYVGGGDGTDCLINPLDHNHQIKANNGSLTHYTLDNWTHTYNFPAVSDPADSWFKPIILLSNDTVYWGLTDVWKSTNKGVSFAKIFNVPGSLTLRRLAVAPSNHQVFYFFNDSNFYKTFNDFSNYSPLTSFLPCPAYQISQVEVKETDPNTLWITNNNWNNRNGVFRSTDGGFTWDSISEGLPVGPWYDIIQNDLQTEYEELYICGFFGVYMKYGDDPWVPFKNGLPNTNSFDMDIYYDGENSKLRIGTHGRGVWETDLFSQDANTPGIWTGLYDDNWHDYRNWKYGGAPTSEQVVTIPNYVPNFPRIFQSNVTLANLTINPGSRLSIDGEILSITGDLEINGSLKMSGPNSEVEVHGDISWMAGSSFSATTSQNNLIRTYGNWTFEEGANSVRTDSAEVRFLGNNFSAVYVMGLNCSFGDLAIMKGSGFDVIIEMQSTFDLDITGDLTITATADFMHNSSRDLTVYGDIQANGKLYFQQGKCLLKGENASVQLSAASYFNDLEIVAYSSSLKTLASDVLVQGDLYLSIGSLAPSSYDLELRGDVTGAVGELEMGTGRLIFSGSNPQNINTHIHCNIMELAKPADTLIINQGKSITCSQYLCTDGVLAVAPFANFYAEDLFDDGITGSFFLQEDGFIELTQDVSQSIDINGVINIEGGTFFIYGGSGASNWPGTTNSELWISGGVLDFREQGIHLSNAATFLEVITGGVIRTKGSFTSDRNDFTPVGGYIELYGTADADLAHGIGGAFWEVRIDKGTGTANAIQNLTFDNKLLINSGSLDVNGKVIGIANDLDIFGSLHMTTPACAVNVGGNVNWEAGSSSNINDGLITFKKSWYFHDGTNALLSGSNVVKATSSAYNQYIYHQDADASFANFSSEKPFVTTQRHLYLDNSSPYPMQVSGDFTLGNANSIRVDSAQLMVSGNILTNASSFMRLYNTGSMSANTATINGIVNLFGGSMTAGSATINGGMVMTDDGQVILPDLTLNGTLDINSGSVLVHNNFSQDALGHLILDGGSFIIDKAYTGTLFGFSGITDLNGGFFEISYDGIQFGSGATVNFNGGDLRIGGHFRAVNASSFQPTSGTVELINTIGTNIEVNNGNYFHHLLINKNTGANACLLAYPATIQGDLTLQSGELGTMNNTLAIGGDLLISASGRLSPGSGEVYVGGDWINNRGTSGFIEATSSVWFTSANPATVCSETFYKLDLDKSLASGQYLSMTAGAVINVLDKFTLNDGALLMSNNASLTVNGDLHIKDGGGLNANGSATATTINCYGHWWDYNLITDEDQGFNCGESTVNFKGAAEQELVALDGATFYTLNLQKPSDALVPYNNVTVENDLNLQTGDWEYGTTGLTHVFKSDFNYLAGASWLDHKNTVSFEGYEPQSINNTNGSTLEFGKLQVDQVIGGSSMFTIGSDIICSEAEFISGDIFISGHDFDCWEHFSVLEDANVQFTSGSTVRIGDGGDIDVNGGSLFIGGDPANLSLVSHIGYGYYDFLVHNGGELTSLHTVYEYMGTRGIEIDEDGYLDENWPFYGCTFQNGQSSGSLLLINNAQDVYLHDVNFPENTWSGSYNVSKNTDFGNVYLPDAIGTFSGPFYEYDPNNRIHWPSTGMWEGDFSTEWHDARNWQYDFQYPNATTDVIIPSGAPNYPVISVQEATIKSLKMEANTSLTINKDSLIVGTWTDIQGTLNMPVNNTALFTDSLVWQKGSSASLADRAMVYISGSMFIRHGSDLNLTLGEIRYYGDGNSKLICHDTAQIHQLSNYKNAPYSLSLAGDTIALLSVNGAFTNGTGAILRCPSSQEWTFNGNFRNTADGHFRCENGSIRLKGSVTSTYFRPNKGDYFHDLIVETTSLLNLYSTYSDTLRIYGDLILNSGPGITANAFNILMLGDWENNAGSGAFSSGSSKVIFPGNGVQQIITGNTNFYNIEAGNSGSGSLAFFGSNSIGNLLQISYPVFINGDLNAGVVNIDESGAEINLMSTANMQIGSLIQGGLIHCQGGTLNVNDLNEDFVFGNYQLDGGLVVLGQTEGASTHDLYGDYTINDGELRFTGGYGSSSWPGPLGGGYANLTMTGGILSLPNHSIEIINNSFIENISGGKISVQNQFNCNSGVTTFHPTGGVVEITGENDCGVSIHSPLSWFWDLHINNGNLGGTTYPGSNLIIKNDLIVVSGTFETDGYDINVGP